MSEETKLPSIKAKLKSEDPWARRLRSLLQNGMAMGGFSIIIFWAIVAIFAEVISPYTPYEQKVADRLQPPSAQHYFGTDELGRDVFSRVVYGARISLPIGLIVIVFAMSVGSLLGATAGYVGGVFDLVVMRFADITLAFPSIVAMALLRVGARIRNA